MSDYFGFLKSNRFHAAMGIGVLLYLISVGFVPANIGDPIIVILLAHIGVRTIDRHGEKAGK